MDKSLNRIVAINTLSNYALIAIRIIYVILITRFLYRALGEDYYGFWSILWAFFTYVAVFNFGFGATVQKFTAEHLFDTDPEKYNKIISVVMFAYFAVSVIILGVVGLGIFNMGVWTNISNPIIMYDCKLALLIFGIGMAILFPLSTFVDILTGLRLIYLKNIVMIILRIVEIFGIYALIIAHSKFIYFVIFSSIMNVGFTAFLAFIVKKKIPAFKLLPRIDFSVFKEIWNFSFFVYLNSLAMLITAKTDRFVLSSILGLPSVSAYQIGTRLPEMSQSLSSQFQDNVIPVASNLAKKNDLDGLKTILVNGMRFSSFVSFGATALFFVLTPQTLKVLFGFCTPEINSICRIFLVSQFVYCAVRNVPYRYLQVSSKHKFIAMSSTIQTILTITLGIYLCKKIGTIGIAWAALIPNLLISVVVIFPVAFKKLNIGFNDLWAIYAKPFIISLITGTFCFGIEKLFGPDSWSIYALFIAYFISGLLYLGLAYLFVLSKNERKYIVAMILSRFLGETSK